MYKIHTEQKNRLPHLLLLFVITILFGFGISQQCFAQKKINDSTYKISEREKAVVAFFKLAGVAPDYEAWVTETAAYKAIEDKKEKESFLVDESLRLGQGYTQYEITKGLLEFKTTVTASYTPPKEDESAKFHFKFPNQDDNYIPVFEYPYGNNSIVLIVNRFSDFASLSLTEEQFEVIKQLMPYYDEEYTAKLVMSVRPTRANFKEPIINKNTKQWMMLGEIARISFMVVDPTNLQQTKIWDYVAPWHEANIKEEKKVTEKALEEESYPHPYDLFKDKK